MTKDLDGRVALVTGAGGAGCGRAISRELASRGAAVVGVDKHERRCREVIEEVARDFDVPTLSFGVDVTDRDGIDAALADAVQQVGAVDILVNNAAINVQGSVFDYDPDTFDEVMAVDFNACWYLTRRTIGGMRDNGGGAIINISSVAGYLGGAGAEAPYAAAKAALHDLTRSTAIEGGPHGIRCNAIAVGIVDSKFVQKHWAKLEPSVERTPLRRVAQPEEIARVVAFLAGEDSSFITGDIINASGGYWLSI